MEDPQAEDKSRPERSVPRFDPVAGMRAMADIQAEGLRAAGDLLERMLGSEPADPGSRSRSSAGDYTALVDAWTDLIRRFVAGLAQPAQTGPVTVPVGSNGVGPPVQLSLNGSGSIDGAMAEVWLHNETFSAVGPLVLRCGQLTASDGTVLDGGDVCFEPGDVPILPARSSRAVVVSLTATGPLRPGTYRGTIQADGAPGLWLPVEVAIDPC
jgi:hypothetical protein